MNNLLSEIALFRNLNEVEYSMLKEVATLKNFKKGELIFQKNSQAEVLYLVQKGLVKLYNQRKGTLKEEIVCVIRQNGYFCLAPLLSREKLHVNAASIEATETLIIPKVIIHQLIASSHTFSKNVITSLAGKECDLCEEVCDLSLSSTKERLAKYLLKEFDSHQGKRTIRLPLKQGSLASHLGTVRETLSRDMADLKKAGVIDNQKGALSLLDRDELIQITKGTETL